MATAAVFALAGLHVPFASQNSTAPVAWVAGSWLGRGPLAPPPPPRRGRARLPPPSEAVDLSRHREMFLLREAEVAAVVAAEAAVD